MDPVDQFEADMTMLQHMAEDEHVNGAVVPPIFQTSLFVFDRFDSFQASILGGKGGGHGYSRISNPTVAILESKIAALEEAEAALVFGSGMAATSSTVMSRLKPGQHVVVVDTIYGPARRFLTEYLASWGVTHTLVDGRDTKKVLAALRPETALLYLESPSSILFRLQDLAALATACKAAGVTTVVDNTYGLCIQHPIKLGIDIVVHSASKAICGHSDVVAGAVCGSAEAVNAMRWQELELFGSIIAPLPAYLLIRGLRTLPLRLERTRQTANVIAAFVKSRQEVETVMHVGDPDFPQKELRDRQMTGSACLFSFFPKTNERAKIVRFVESLKMFKLGVSWGGHESLVVALAAQAGDMDSERWVIRLCCGFENPADLIADLEQAFPALA